MRPTVPKGPYVFIRAVPLGLAVLIGLGSVSTADELPLEIRWISDVDLERVIPNGNGDFTIQRVGAIDVLHPSGTSETRVVAGGAQSLYVSDDGSRHGVATHRPGAADFAPTASFELRDRSGAVIWRIGSTEDVTYTISSQGVVVGMSLNINIPDRNTLHFYGDAGNQIAEVPVPYLTGGSFSPSGERFFALGASEGLLAFDAIGQMLWQFPGVRLFATTPDGSVAAVVTGETLSVLRQGNPVASILLEDPLVRRIAIAPDASRVVIAERRKISVYGADDLELLWSTGSGAADHVFTSVDIGTDNGWVAAGIARDLGSRVSHDQRHPTGEVRAYDAAGALIHHVPMKFDAWNIWTPTVVLESDTIMTVTTRRGVFRAVLP